MARECRSTFSCLSKPPVKLELIQLTNSIPGRVWTFMENISDTTYDFALVLRQMYTEAILREKLDSVGALYCQETQCIDFEVDETAPLGSHKVTSTFKDLKTEKVFKLKR